MSELYRIKAPTNSMNKVLDKFCDHISTFPIQWTTKPNTSQKEWEIIHELKINNIIIKEADKKSTIIIMDVGHYKNTISSLLQDTTYYKKV